MIRTVDGSAATTSAVRAIPRSAPTSPTKEPGTVMSGSRGPSSGQRQATLDEHGDGGVVGIVLGEEGLARPQPALRAGGR